MKQELTVHATSKSPITIQMIQGEHFGTQPVAFKKGERKLYGPFLLYANTSNSKDRNELIADAKAMAHQQEQEWPFQWFENELYPLDRSTVNGRINVTTGQGSDSIRVVLAEPGDGFLHGGGGADDLDLGKTGPEQAFQNPLSTRLVFNDQCFHDATTKGCGRGRRRRSRRR